MKDELEVINDDKNNEEILRNFFEKLLENQKEIPPEFVQVLNDHFWELI